MSYFQTARIFSDNMVLQYGRPINVFGTGTDGTRVTVRFDGKSTAETSVTVKNGRWLAVLPPEKPQSGAMLSVSGGGETVTFSDVAVGAVWLAGGQSNMELELQNCSTGKESLENDDPDVRFYYTQKKSVYEKDFFDCERLMCWQKFSNKDSAKCWSAVGYYFAKELSERLGVTVGIIGCNWGGTSASAWISREYAVGETSVYFEDYDRATAGKTDAGLIKEYREYQEYHAAWEKKSAEYYGSAENPTWEGCLEYCGENKYPGPHSPINPVSPGILHKSMTERVAPYTMTGVIWYQGESDDHRPAMYYTLLKQLIRCWRDDWNDDELFFVIGQLPMHKWEADADFKNWCVIREAQAKAVRNIKHTALAVLTDCGERNEIHPRDKKTPGHRFCLAALNGCYHIGSDAETGNPSVESLIWNENGVELIISDGHRLCVRGELSGFELCGADGVYSPAAAELIHGETRDIIRLSGSEPRGARYLWTNYTEDIPLYDEKNGIPFASFIIEKSIYKGEQT